MLAVNDCSVTALVNASSEQDHGLSINKSLLTILASSCLASSCLLQENRLEARSCVSKAKQEKRSDKEEAKKAVRQPKIHYFQLVRTYVFLFDFKIGFFVEFIAHCRVRNS